MASTSRDRRCWPSASAGWTKHRVTVFQMNIEEAIVDSRGGLFRSASKTAAFFFPIISFLLAMGQMIAQSGDAPPPLKVGVFFVVAPAGGGYLKGKAGGNPEGGLFPP